MSSAAEEAINQATVAFRRLGELLSETARQLQAQAKEDGRRASLAGKPRRARGEFDTEDFGMRGAWLAGWDDGDRQRRLRALEVEGAVTDRQEGCARDE